MTTYIATENHEVREFQLVKIIFNGFCKVIQFQPVEIVCGRSITPGGPSSVFCGKSGQLAHVDMEEEEGMPPREGEGVVAVLSVPVPLPLLPPLS